MDKLYEEMLSVGETFNQDLVDLMSSITKMPYDSDFTFLWDKVSELANGCFEPIAFTLATFFFLVGFLKKTIMFEFVTMENVVKCLLRLVVAKIIIDNSLLVVHGFAQVMDGIMAKTLLATGTPQKPADIFDVASALLQFTPLGFVDKILKMVMELPIFLVMLACKFIIFIQLWGRFLQICLFAMVSPLPLATMVSEETSGVAKKFIQSYVAVLLQGLMIFLVVYLYILFMANINNDWGTWFPGSALHVQLLVTIILVFMVAKAGNWAKQIMGV